MTLRSQHQIRHRLSSGPGPGRTGGLVPSGATLAKDLYAPLPLPWEGTPPGRAGTTIVRSFFTEIAMGLDDGHANEGSTSRGSASVG